MLQFTKTIQFIQPELFNPSLGVFTLLEGITNIDGTDYVQFRIHLLQNMNNIDTTTVRQGTYFIPKSVVDSFEMDIYGNITNELAVNIALSNFNIKIPTDNLICNIVFFPNGGYGNMDSQAMLLNVPTNLRSNSFVKDDHVFLGWSTSDNGGVIYTDNESISVQDSDLNLYAIWTT